MNCSWKADYAESFFQRWPKCYLPFTLFSHRQTSMLLPFRNRSEGLTRLPSSHLLVSHTIWVWARRGIETSTLFDGTLMVETWATTDDVLRWCSVRKPSHTVRACVGGPVSSPFNPRARHMAMQSPAITSLPSAFDSSQLRPQTSHSHCVLSQFLPRVSYHQMIVVLHHYLWWFVTHLNRTRNHQVKIGRAIQNFYTIWSYLRGETRKTSIEYLRYYWASLVAQMVKNLPTVQETQVRSLGWEDPWEKGMATNSNILAWRTPWPEEPGGLQSMGSIIRRDSKQNGYHGCGGLPASCGTGREQTELGQLGQEKGGWDTLEGVKARTQ